VEPLIAVLEDKDENEHFWRDAAIEALGKIGDRRAVQPLIEVLSNEMQPLAVQVEVTMSLGRIGDPEAEPILAHMNNSSQSWLQQTANVALLKIDAKQGFKVTPCLAVKFFDLILFKHNQSFPD